MAKRLLPWVVVLIAQAIVFNNHMHYFNLWMPDDSYIAFRYAANLADGYGPVYNIGEAPVEGYTCFLWVALLAGGRLLGLDIIFLSRLLGALFGAGMLVLLAYAWLFIPKLSPYVCAGATLLFATFAAFHLWLTSGMECILFSFLVLLAVLLHIRTRYVASRSLTYVALGMICLLAALTRPEGALVFALIGLEQVLAGIWRREGRFLWCWGVFGVFFGAYLYWRFSYYGFLLPNTFYVKVGSGIDQVYRGARYAQNFAYPAMGLIIPGVLMWIFPRAWRDYGRAILLPVLVAVYTAYIISVGGDFFSAFRFFIPIIAPLSLVAAMGLSVILRKRFLVVPATGIVLAFQLYQMSANPYLRERIPKLDGVQLKGIEVGVWLREHVPADSLLATNTAGTIPFYSGLRTIDMLGLNDKHIAHRDIPTLGKGFPGHEKGDGAYVLSRKPDYIQLGSAGGSKEPRSFIGDKEIFRHPDFKRYYQYRRYRMPSGRKLEIYERRKTPLP